MYFTSCAEADLTVQPEMFRLGHWADVGNINCRPVKLSFWILKKNNRAFPPALYAERQ